MRNLALSPKPPNVIRPAAGIKPSSDAVRLIKENPMDPAEKPEKRVYVVLLFAKVNRD